MKATAEHIELEGCQREIVFSVANEEAETALNKLARKYKDTIQLKGFRPGKVPMTLLRQRFSKELEAELIHENLPEMLEKEIKAKDDSLQEKGFKKYLEDKGLV